MNLTGVLFLLTAVVYLALYVRAGGMIWLALTVTFGALAVAQGLRR